MGRNPKISKVNRPCKNTDRFFSHAEMIEMRISKQTRDSYVSAIKTHQEAGFNATFAGFRRHCGWEHCAMSLGKARLTRVALMWRADMQERPWTEQQKIH